MDTDIEGLTRALRYYVEAALDEERERDRYEGGSWGYHGSSLIYERDKAASDLAAKLDAYIDQRVAAALARITPPVTSVS